MSKVIDMYTREEYREEVIIPLTYNRALDEDDYALYKARQQKNNNITVLNTDIDEYEDAWEDEE